MKGYRGEVKERGEKCGKRRDTEKNDIFIIDKSRSTQTGEALRTTDGHSEAEE